MNSENIGVQSFHDLREREERARNMYQEYAKKVTDSELKKLFLTIAEQEQGHMEIADKLIKLVQ